MRRFLAPNEVAEILGVSPAHVRRHAHQLGCIRIGSLYKFPEGVIRHLAEYGTLPACHPASPESTSTNAAQADTASGGANTDGSTKNAATPPKQTPRTARRKSGSAFVNDFPEFAHLAR